MDNIELMNMREEAVDARPGTPSEPQAAAVREAFLHFQTAIYPSDARAFRSTTLEQVREAARVIERDQEKRKCLRNLRRIKPFFEALARFGGCIETLCQGTPYLCFIWAPIKLLLTIADEYSSGFEKLVDAYSQIAQNLPRFDRLSDAFKHQPDFQAVLADVYVDLLDFHLHAYKFLRRSGWKHLWDASWRGFGSRFNALLENLNRSRDLVDREAASFEILEAKSMRTRLLAALDRSEAERREWQLRDSLAWLDLQGHDREQDDLLERRSTSRQPGTCEWFLRHPKVVAWLDEEDQRSMLWLKGKPGAGESRERPEAYLINQVPTTGKTTLACYLMQTASISLQSSMFYCLCPDRLTRPGSNVCGLVFRSLVAQLIRAKSEVLPYVYETFVKLGATPSLCRVRDLLGTLLRCPGTTFLILDGLDECEPQDQRLVVSELQNLLKPDARAGNERLKILICSRETKDILRKLHNIPQVFLSHEQDDMSKDIAKFTESSLAELFERFPPEVVNEVCGEVVQKADGELFDHVEHGDSLTAADRYVPLGATGLIAAARSREHR
jgi:NACHT domain